MDHRDVLRGPGNRDNQIQKSRQEVSVVVLKLGCFRNMPSGGLNVKNRRSDRGNLVLNRFSYTNMVPRKPSR